MAINDHFTPLTLTDRVKIINNWLQNICLVSPVSSLRIDLPPFKVLSIRQGPRGSRWHV